MVKICSWMCGCVSVSSHTFGVEHGRTNAQTSRRPFIVVFNIYDLKQCLPVASVLCLVFRLFVCWEALTCLLFVRSWLYTSQSPKRQPSPTGSKAANISGLGKSCNGKLGLACLVLGTVWQIQRKASQLFFVLVSVCVCVRVPSVCYATRTC